MSLRYNGEQSFLGFDERTVAPSAPSAGQLVYFRSGVLYKLDSAGDEQAVGSGATLNDIIVSSSSATGIPLTVQPHTGASSSAVLQEWRNGAGVVVARLYANGDLEVAGSITTSADF